MILSFFVQIIELQSKSIDSSAHCNLISSHVVVQFDVDFIENVFGAAIKTIVETVWPQLKTAFEEIKTALANMGVDWGTIGEVLKFIGIVVIGGLAAIFLTLVGVIVGVVNAIAGALTAFTGHMQSVYDRGKEI